MRKLLSRMYGLCRVQQPHAYFSHWRMCISKAQVPPNERQLRRAWHQHVKNLSRMQLIVYMKTERKITKIKRNSCLFDHLSIWPFVYLTFCPFVYLPNCLLTLNRPGYVVPKIFWACAMRDVERIKSESIFFFLFFIPHSNLLGVPRGSFLFQQIFCLQFISNTSREYHLGFIKRN